jgi:hypothetical protein
MVEFQMNMNSYPRRGWRWPIPRRAAVTLVVVAMSICITPSQVAASSLQKVNKLALQCREGKQKACSELAKMAVEDKDAYVRRLAAMELTDQSLLAGIAIADKDFSVRRAVMTKLTDQSLLAKVAAEATDAGVRSTAVVNLTDQSLLTKVAIADTNANVRRLAVMKLTDQSQLAKITVEATDAGVRSTAVAKLTDRSLLANVAAQATDVSIRSAAVARLTDQSLLAKIAVEDRDASVRSAALATLTDQSLLAKIAVEATDVSIRSAAVARLADQSLLAKIAVEDTDAGVRSAALAAAEQVRRDIIEGRDIVDLLNERKIEIQVRGSGIQRVSVGMRKLVPYPVIVRIPAGSFFVSSNASAQNMVTTSESKVQLSAEGWVDVSVDAACANRPKHIPASDDAFTVLRSPHQEELVKLMPVLDRSRVDTITRQAAVWIVTDNADYNDLGILVAGLNGIASYRVIREQETARAMKICDEAGIDITQKAVWKDRQRVISGLKDGELKTWLDQKQ